MRSIIYLMLTLLVCSVNITAQVTIGSDQPPRAGAGLDLRSSDRGLLLPNVALTDPATNFQLKGGEGTTATGMVVYNTSEELDGPGVYVWDGSRWILITCVPETPGTIDLSPTAVNLNGTFTASVPEATGPAAPTSYIWALPTGLNGTSTTHEITITGAAGTYNAGTIKVAATNACGTSAEQTSATAITVRDCSAAPATPTLSVTATTINRTGTATLSCTDVGNGATTYAWTLPTGLTGSSTTRSITVTGATAGAYNANSISVKATNACGYTTVTGSGGAITVRDCTGAPATPTLTVTARTINRTGTATLSCTDAGNGATTYTWTLPSGLTGSSTTNTIVITGATAGTYNANNISVKATNACGNTSATGSGGAITVRDCTAAPATPTLTVTATTINRTGTATLSCTDVGNGATTYEWTLPSGLTGSSTTNSIVITGATAGTYNANNISVKATNTCGNTTATGSGGAITVRDCTGAPATPTLTVTATTINQGGTFQLSCTDVGNGATTYSWTLPSGLTGSSTTNTIVITGATAGTYNANNISVKATNDCGYATAPGSGGAITVNDSSCPNSVTDSQSNTYTTGWFGTAGCWMTQNLRSTTGLTADYSDYSNSTYYYYPNGSQATFNSHPEYGLLYTWRAASGRTSSRNEANSSHGPHQGICPAGWHLPSDLEWTRLTDVISASADGAYSTTTGTGNAGRKMKSTTPVTSQATNGTSKSRTENGFDALLVGNIEGGWNDGYGIYTLFWSSSSYDSSNAWYWVLGYDLTGVDRYYYYKDIMLSVRCKKNE